MPILSCAKLFPVIFIVQKMHILTWIFPKKMLKADFIGYDKSIGYVYCTHFNSIVYTEVLNYILSI